MSLIQLKCSECENSRCCYARRYIPYDSLEGCTRKVSEELELQYEHLVHEVQPFMYMKTTKEYQNKTYNDIINCLQNIYNSPMGQKLDSKGKVRGLSNSAEMDYNYME